MKELVGKKITKIEISNCKQYIRLHTTTKVHTFYAYGDCCSNSWIENVELFGELGKVLDILDIELEALWDSPEERELTRYYGHSIRMEAGRIEIDFRNNSNGYYGGKLSSTTDRYDYEAPDKHVKWKEIHA